VQIDEILNSVKVKRRNFKNPEVLKKWLGWRKEPLVF